MTTNKAHVVGQSLIGEGKWLRLLNVEYEDDGGRKRVWETLERTTHGRAEVDAVEIVGIVKRRGQVPQLIAIKQFRPPTNKYIIELPAGLVDAKEPIPVAAERELKEETGYSGVVVDESPEMLFGMAISSTTIKIVTVDIDGDAPENQNPKQHLEEGEYADVLLIPCDKIFETLKEHQAAGCGIDAKIWMIAYGLQTLTRMLNNSAKNTNSNNSTQ